MSKKSRVFVDQEIKKNLVCCDFIHQPIIDNHIYDYDLSYTLQRVYFYFCVTCATSKFILFFRSVANKIYSFLKHFECRSGEKILTRFDMICEIYRLQESCVN